MRRFCALLSCFGLLFPAVALRAAPRTQDNEAEHASRPTVAVMDFPGDDRALSTFLSDTLLTDLGHSSIVQTLERTDVKQGMTDLEVQDSGPLLPAQVRHLGELIHASNLIVGSFLVRDDQVVINARLLNTHTGLNIPGSSVNAAGPRRSLLAVTHKLAQQLHRKLTGEDLIFEEEVSVPSAESDVQQKDPAPIPPQDLDALDNGKRLGLIPAGAHPNSPLAEREFTGFMARLARHITGGNVLHLSPTSGPVSRMQALTGIVKLIVSNEDVSAFRSASSTGLTPDAAQIPMWGQPYLAAALDQGWWDSAAPFRPRTTATWGFIQIIIAKLPIETEAPRAPAIRPRDETPVASEVFTGLVIDARDFDLKRDHSPRIVDEDGNEVYPDPKHCPSPDYVEEHGMAAYATAENDSHRSGGHPLVVRALGATGPGPFDVVISNEDARRIAEANRRGKFLWKWNVTFVVAER